MAVMSFHKREHFIRFIWFESYVHFVENITSEREQSDLIARKSKPLQ